MSGTVINFPNDRSSRFSQIRVMMVFESKGSVADDEAEFLGSELIAAGVDTLDRMGISCSTASVEIERTKND